MARYEVEFTKELWFRGWVEADSEAEARMMVFSGEVEDLDNYDEAIQDSVDVQEVKE